MLIVAHLKFKIMKRIIGIVIVTAFFAFSANAQIFKYGIKAGVNFASLPMDDIRGITTPTETYSLITGESVTGYQAGLMARIKIAMVYVQPEIYFNTTGGTVEQVVENGPTEILDVQFNRIDIPLLVGLKFGPARINAGPVGSAVISSTNELSEIAPGLETLHEGLSWGFQAGIGLDILKKLAIDARYEGSLSRYGDSFVVAGETYSLDARPSAWILALGWYF